jgi:hypothetical protein
MSTNPIRCGNCGTDNPPGTETCRKCGQPLTLSADEALRTEIAEENNEGLLAAREDATAMGTSGPGTPIVPPRPTN